VRYGLAERLELRIAWDEGIVFDRSVEQNGRVVNQSGSTDIEFGIKYAIRKQDKWRPNMAIILAVSAPIGNPAFSSQQVDPLVNFLYSWDVTKKLSFACSTGNQWTAENVLVAAPYDHYSLFFQSASLDYELTKKLSIFNEWFALFRYSSNDNRPQHYYDGGFTFLVTKNFQLDWRAGIGLSETSDRFFTGCGVTLRK
jgi:hypothetical protein